MADVEENALYASRVEHSLVELQQAVKDHEAALRKVCATVNQFFSPVDFQSVSCDILTHDSYVL